MLTLSGLLAPQHRDVPQPDHSIIADVVGSVRDKLTELERSGQYPGAIDAL
ncbi:MAG: hypothetical protein ACRDTA_08525 [Pseudonocardiaceae bacterium]